MRDAVHATGMNIVLKPQKNSVRAFKVTYRAVKELRNQVFKQTGYSISVSENLNDLC